mmetsp:Transcript_57750/g.68922  ORF Transcript_57750/g.68922 Transcript_57750/m.68922 type:complete len:155 (-) Transcript_57750:245-709(-)|eukprot:CAMPEP_0172499930 /NCGR_PEP_ID=MMETSP1066-20121228/132533_1 /TAXON_ID=671091 /ORGANISM="Coscinodiscus wailesii, Strain CCMP2513" /LENGTH=154 /DNA_ID=CAMNT_0013273925 /DNA_START=114 /DNA_END=578 /DNA_ORIENTATION=-
MTSMVKDAKESLALTSKINQTNITIQEQQKKEDILAKQTTLQQHRHTAGHPMTTNPSDGVLEENKVKKKKERLEQNRISARESRKRKKTMIEDLQRTVITLSRENKDLNQRNESLRRQLIEIGTKYPNAVSLHALMGPNMALTPPCQTWHEGSS